VVVVQGPRHWLGRDFHHDVRSRRSAPAWRTDRGGERRFAVSGKSMLACWLSRTRVVITWVSVVLCHPAYTFTIPRILSFLQALLRGIHQYFVPVFDLSMSTCPRLIEDRHLPALERTYLGYFRTSTLLATAGVFITQLYVVQEEPAEPVVITSSSTGSIRMVGRSLATALFALALGTVVCGTCRFVRFQRALVRGVALSGLWFELFFVLGGAGIVSYFFSFPALPSSMSWSCSFCQGCLLTLDGRFGQVEATKLILRNRVDACHDVCHCDHEQDLREEESALAE